MIGFEARPLPAGARPARLAQPRPARSTSSCATRRGLACTRWSPGLWGGMALDPYVLDRGVRGPGALDRRIRSPSSARALDLEPIPVPDFTTENGRRLLFIHIDGDSFASHGGDARAATSPGRSSCASSWSATRSRPRSRSSRARPRPRACTPSCRASWSRSPSRSSGCPTSRWPATRSATRSTGCAAAKGLTRADGLEGPRAHADPRLQVHGRPRGGRVDPVHQRPPGPRRTSRPRCSCGAGRPCPGRTP